MTRKLTALLLVFVCLFTMTSALAADENAGIMVDGIAAGLNDAMTESGAAFKCSTSERNDTLVGFIVVDFDKCYISFFGSAQTTWMDFSSQTDLTDFVKCALAAVRVLESADLKGHNITMAMMFNEEFTIISDLAPFDAMLAGLLEN